MPDEPPPEALDDVDEFQAKSTWTNEDTWLWELEKQREERLRIQHIKNELTFWMFIAILFSISGGLFLARFVG